MVTWAARRVGTVFVRAHDNDTVYVQIERNMNRWMLPWTAQLVGLTVTGWPYTVDESVCWSEAGAIRAGQRMLARERAAFRRQMKPRRLTEEEITRGAQTTRRPASVLNRDHQDGPAV